MTRTARLVSQSAHDKVLQLRPRRYLLKDIRSAVRPTGTRSMAPDFFTQQR